MAEPHASARPAIGAVCIGMSVQHPREAGFAAAGKAALAASVFIALILWMEIRQLRNLLAPLRRLADFTVSVGQENLDRRAETGGVGEISDLAVAFNRMLDRLAATLVSKDLAEQANLAKSRFLATAGHELRTPLNAVIGYSELLEEECTDRGLEDLVPDLHRIRNSGRMLLELMNDLLDYSKSEAGRLEMKAEEVSIADVIEEVASTVAPMARQNHNQLIVESPGDLLAYADRGRFRQSLLNLASNACKFTDHGTITLSAARAGDGEHKHCEIHVRDTGIGIAPKEVVKLFEAFVQVDSTATRQYGGTGLGLAISRRFCRMMGGDIRVESRLGQGSLFTISLPASSGQLKNALPRSK
jgi:signal transduction histidine kinase